MISNTSIADLSRFRRGPFTDRANERREAIRHLRSLNTQPDAPQRVARLFSGGNQQKAVLPAGCCAPARCCCSTNRLAVSTSALGLRSIE